MTDVMSPAPPDERLFVLSGANVARDGLNEAVDRRKIEADTALANEPRFAVVAVAKLLSGGASGLRNTG